MLVVVEKVIVLMVRDPEKPKSYSTGKQHVV
jgi:hypothetical protein